jgi:hypothetical protein
MKKQARRKKFQYLRAETLCVQIGLKRLSR